MTGRDNSDATSSERDGSHINQAVPLALGVVTGQVGNERNESLHGTAKGRTRKN